MDPSLPMVYKGALTYVSSVKQKSSLSSWPYWINCLLTAKRRECTEFSRYEGGVCPHWASGDKKGGITTFICLSSCLLKQERQPLPSTSSIAGTKQQWKAPWSKIPSEGAWSCYCPYPLYQSVKNLNPSSGPQWWPWVRTDHGPAPCDRPWTRITCNTCSGIHTTQPQP